MNRFTLTLAIALMSCQVLFAQNTAVYNANFYKEEGSLDKAKQEVDKAVVHEKTKADAKTWYTKGVIYLDLSRSQNPAYKSLASDPLKEAIEAFTKAKELDVAKKEYYQKSDDMLKVLWGDVINRGVEEYNKAKMKDALSWFELAKDMNAKDTLGPLYACAAAEALGDMNSLKANTDHLVAMNYKSADVYRSRIKVESDLSKKLQIAKQGHADFPKDNSLSELVGDLSAAQGNHQDAIAAFQDLATRIQDKEGNLNAKIAFQYQKLKQNDKALEYYEKAVQINNNNYLAHYNAMVLYYEKGKSQYDVVHNMNVKDYQQHGKPIEDAMKAVLAKAANHGNVAVTLTSDEDDKKNINLVLSEIKKMTASK